MQRILSILVIGGGLAFLAAEHAPSPSDREEQIAAMTRIVARATILEPETVPAEQPGLRRPINSPAAATPTLPPATAPALETAALAAVTVVAPAPVATVRPPPGTGIQRHLAREIQAELKRVGCYSGRLDGTWGDRSRSAMTTFMARVNAQLPTTEPDVFLLSLIKGQTHAVCGPTCGRDEILDGNRCVARTVVAEAARAVSANNTSVTTTRVTRAADPPIPQPAAIAAVRADPLPGRMSIGGPVQPANAPAQPVTSAPLAETLPWATPPKSAGEGQLAALTADDQADPIAKAPPAPRRVTKTKRAWSPPARPKPVKRRYTSQRSVQMLFLHPLGRM